MYRASISCSELINSAYIANVAFDAFITHINCAAKRVIAAP